jgi:hypothetical protein
LFNVNRNRLRLATHFSFSSYPQKRNRFIPNSKKARRGHWEQSGFKFQFAFKRFLSPCRKRLFNAQDLRETFRGFYGVS